MEVCGDVGWGILHDMDTFVWVLKVEVVLLRLTYPLHQSWMQLGVLVVSCGCEVSRLNMGCFDVAICVWHLLVLVEPVVSIPGLKLVAVQTAYIHLRLMRL